MQSSYTSDDRIGGGGRQQEGQILAHRDSLAALDSFASRHPLAKLAKDTQRKDKQTTGKRQAMRIDTACPFPAPELCRRLRGKTVRTGFQNGAVLLI